MIHLQSKLRPKSREEAHRRNPQQIEEQYDQHRIRRSQDKHIFRQQPKRKTRNHHIRRQPHRAHIQQRPKARIRPLILRHALNTSLLDLELARQPLHLRVPAVADLEALAGHGVRLVDQEGAIAVVAMAFVVGVVAGRVVGGGGRCSAGLFFDVVGVVVAHLAYAGACGTTVEEGMGIVQAHGEQDGGCS